MPSTLAPITSILQHLVQFSCAGPGVGNHFSSQALSTMLPANQVVFTVVARKDLVWDYLMPGSR